MDLTVAADFPKANYVDVEERFSVFLTGRDAGSVPGFREYAGGWNAVIQRFRSADEYSATAAQLLGKNYGSMQSEERYETERALFGFFTSVQSTIESFCFGVYGIGRMKDPAAFNAQTERDITVQATSNAVKARFGGTALDRELAALGGDATWERVKEIRNVLAHRVSPGITIFVSGYASRSGRPPPAGVLPPPRPAEWTGRNVALEPGLVTDPRSWLGAKVTALVVAVLDLVKASF